MSRRPRGRPKLKAEDRRSEPISVRLTPALRKQLEEARHSPDISHTLSQEIELRLRRSFAIDNEIAKKFGSPATYAFLRIVATGIQDLCPDDRLWLDDRFVFDQVTVMINALLSNLRPGGKSMKEYDDFSGEEAAEELVANLALAATNPDLLRLFEDDPTSNIFIAAAIPLLRRFKRSELLKWKADLKTKKAKKVSMK